MGARGHRALRLIYCSLYTTFFPIKGAVLRNLAFIQREGAGACFSKVPITFRARKAVYVAVFPFAFKASIILKIKQ